MSQAEQPERSSTPIKSTVQASQMSQSVDDLLQAIDKNISSSSLNQYEDDSANNVSISFNTSDDNPVQPLNLKPLSNVTTESKENVMENIPRAPSFDELEFNTRLNRATSLSRLSGPRQLANSTLSRTLSNNKMGRSSSFKSSGQTTRDNSPSKKSVCFEESPPKIVEYEEYTPEQSDNSLEDQQQPDDTFESNWTGKLKPSELVLPPPPPKHQILTPSPQKDTTLGSSDEDSHDFNLTKEELQNASVTLEQRLDLVLDSDDISKRVQQDEINRGSGSPLRSLSQKEEEVILNIKSKDEIAEENLLRDASEMFEQDLRNTDKNAHVLRLDPVLKRKNSNNSLKDEERVLQTEIVAQTTAPVVVGDGLKNVDLEQLSANARLSFAESTTDSFASATDIFESEPIEIKKEPTSSNSISTLQDEDEKKKKKGHSKKLSISESINSFLSGFGMSPKKDDVQIRREHSAPVSIPGEFIIKKEEEEEVTPTPEEKELPIVAPAPVVTEPVVTEPVVGQSSMLDDPVDPLHVDNNDVLSIQSSIEPEEEVEPATDARDVSVEHQSLLQHSSPVFAAELENSTDVLLLERPQLLQDAEIEGEVSFVDEFKETGLFNSSDRMNEDYRTTPEKLEQVDNVLDELDNEEVVEVAEPETIERSMTPEPGVIEVEESPMLKSPFDESAHKPDDEPRVSSFAVQTEPIEVEVAVQTDDFDFKSLAPTFETITEPERQGATLPSFNSTLFHDKPPKEDDYAKPSPPTSYIDIWHSLPKTSSPQPQYSLGTANATIRTASPPESLLRRLSTRKSSRGSRGEKITLDSTQLKQEEGSERRRLSLIMDDSFVATSVSQPSFIKIESRNTSLLSHDLSRRVDSSFDSSQILADSSGLALPDISSSSDFGSAFKDWAVPPSINPDNTMKLDEAKKAAVNPAEDIKAIWGSNESTPVMEDKSRTPSVDAGKIQTLINTGETRGEKAHVKSSSAVGEVIVTKSEDHGVDVEFDGESQYSMSKTSKDVPLASMLDVHNVPRVVKKVSKQSVAEPQPQHTRLVSGDNKFDFASEFEKAVGGTSTDVLDSEELSKPMVPEADPLNYMKTRVKRDTHKPQGPRVRTPLAALADSDVNQRSTSSGTQRIVSQPASENYQIGDNFVKKRDSRMSMFEDPTSTKLPEDDKGRLYIHINSLNEIMLDQIKNHKACFKLYLDNGKHTISTPKMDLSNNVSVDKEFEVAIDEDTTDLFFTFKISYHRPENELVEVYEKIPVKGHVLGRLVGMKPKYRYEKAFVTRKKESDSWDNKFANDGSFGKNKISFFTENNDVTGKPQNYIIELFNEWETQVQNGKEYHKPPHLIAKMDVTMLYIPRTSPLETLPPSMKIANTIAGHIIEQAQLRYEGFLFQEGGDCDLWKRRFFKLEGTKLIAHHELTKKPRAQINLLKVVDIVHNGKKKEQGQRNFTEEILMNDGFKLKFKNGEIITFNAETKELKDRWIEVLEKVVGANRFHQPWVRALAKNLQGTAVQ